MLLLQPATAAPRPPRHLGTRPAGRLIGRSPFEGAPPTFTGSHGRREASPFRAPALPDHQCMRWAQLWAIAARRVLVELGPARACAVCAPRVRSLCPAPCPATRLASAPRSRRTSPRPASQIGLLSLARPPRLLQHVIPNCTLFACPQPASRTHAHRPMSDALLRHKALAPHSSFLLLRVSLFSPN